MTRTPDEIKKGLECCSNVNFVCNEECPYYKSLSEGEDCCLKKNADALALIQQLERDKAWAGEMSDMLREENKRLEAQNAELSGEIGQLQAERDAAVEDMATAVVNSCDVCMHNEEDIETAPCNSCMHIFKGRESKFKWRGVQKEDGNASD